MGQKEYQKSILDEESYLVSDAKRLHTKIVNMVQDAEESLTKSSDKYKNGAIQWAVRGRQFNPAGETVSNLPSGWYKFSFNGQTMVPELLDIRNDELIKLPMPEYEHVLDDMKRFWASESKYRQHNFPYKRGIILFGRPGTGKTGLLRLLAGDLVSEHNGVIFNIGSPDDIHAFESAFSAFREIEPNRKAIVIMEDVDNFMRYGGSTQQKLLNILDGNMQYDNIVFLATTNFPHMLLESLSNRPSRFDRRYEISTPSEEARTVYIKTKFSDLAPAEVEKLAKATEGFSIDQLKETILSIYVLGYPFDDTIKMMKELFVFNGNVSKGDDPSRFGKSYDSEYVKGATDIMGDSYSGIDEELNR